MKRRDFIRLLPLALVAGSAQISPATANATITIPGCFLENALKDTENISPEIRTRIKANKIATTVLDICALALVISAVAQFFNRKK